LFIFRKSSGFKVKDDRLKDSLQFKGNILQLPDRGGKARLPVFLIIEYR